MNIQRATDSMGIGFDSTGGDGWGASPPTENVVRATTSWRSAASRVAMRTWNVADSSGGNVTMSRLASAGSSANVASPTGSAPLETISTSVKSSTIGSLKSTMTCSGASTAAEPSAGTMSRTTA